MSHPATFPSGEYGRVSRLGPLPTARDAISARDLFVLVAAGALAAVAVAFVPPPFRVPGHAILKGALPIVLGVALVPRTYAGTISGTAAGLVAGLLLIAGAGNLQTAALTALLAIGPAIDLAMRGAKRGGLRLYLRFAAAGLLANSLAFFVRWGVAALALDTGRPHTLKHVGLMAFLSFAVCGVVAGLISSAACFRGAPKVE